MGPIPDELVQGFLDLYNLMNVEMPTGDIELEEGRRTPEVQAAQEDEIREAGPHPADRRWRYSPAGEAVAYSNVVTGASDSDDPGSTSGRRSCGPTTAATGSAWPSSAR